MTKGCLVWREPGQCATMAATTSISMAEELLNSIQPRPYAGIVSYLSPSSFLTITDFEKSTLALTNWLDLPASDQHKKVENAAIQMQFLECSVNIVIMSLVRYEQKC